MKSIRVKSIRVYVLKNVHVLLRHVKAAASFQPHRFELRLQIKQRRRGCRSQPAHQPQLKSVIAQHFPRDTRHGSHWRHVRTLKRREEHRCGWSVLRVHGRQLLLAVPAQ